MEETDLSCTICFELAIDCYDSNCCHTIYCSDCVKRLSECPICRLIFQCTKNIAVSRMARRFQDTIQASTTKQASKPQDDDSKPQDDSKSKSSKKSVLKYPPKICNPQTGEIINMGSIEYNTLVKDGVLPLDPRFPMDQPVSCPDDDTKVLNPKTCKWINRGGTIYNTLVLNGIIPETPKSTSTQELSNDDQPSRAQDDTSQRKTNKRSILKYVPKIINPQTGNLIYMGSIEYNTLVKDNILPPDPKFPIDQVILCPDDDTKVLNPKTCRWIDIGGSTYNTLITEGIIPAHPDDETEQSGSNLITNIIPERPVYHATNKDKVWNPETRRWISIKGLKYESLVKRGIIIADT